MVRSELSDQEDHAILRVAVRNGAVILTPMPASEAQSGAKPGRRPPDRIRLLSPPAIGRAWAAGKDLLEDRYLGTPLVTGFSSPVHLKMSSQILTVFDGPASPSFRPLRTRHVVASRH
jgi:hypothetical protein